MFYTLFTLILQHSALYAAEAPDPFRHRFEQCLEVIREQVYTVRADAIKERYEVLNPSIGISYTPDPLLSTWIADTFRPDCERVGFKVIGDHNDSGFLRQFQRSTYAIVLATAAYAQEAEDTKGKRYREITHILDRMDDPHTSDTVVVLHQGEAHLPPILQPLSLPTYPIATVTGCPTTYYDTFFTLMRRFLLPTPQEAAILDHQEQSFWQGNLLALCQIGLRYERKERPDQAIAWYHRVADNPHPHPAKQWACLRLGQLYAMDFHSASEAHQYLTQVDGIPDAQCLLGILYSEGRDTLPQDQDKAFQHYQRAATSGHAEAQFALGRIKQTQNHPTEALSWYQMAAHQGHCEAHRAMLELMEKGYAVPEQGKSAQEMIIEGLRGEIAEGDQRLAQSQDALREAQAENVQLQEQLQEQEAQRKGLEDEDQRKQAEIDRLTQTIAQCQREQQQQTQVLHNENQIKQAEIARLTHMMQALTAERDALHLQLHPPVPLAPPIAQGYEADYDRFLRGVLVYCKGKPQEFRLPIAELINPETRQLDPLNGQFNLGDCGDTGQHLAIYTGYRKAKIPANQNKLEIWLTPWFQMHQETSAGRAQPFNAIMQQWNPQVALFGLFYNWGGWDNLDWYDYLTNTSPDHIMRVNLFENWLRTRRHWQYYQHILRRKIISRFVLTDA